MPKLLFSFLVLSCLPLVVLGYIASRNLEETGLEAIRQAEGMGARNLKSSKQLGKIAIENTVRALDDKSTEAIELRTVELAKRISEFLYERGIVNRTLPFVAFRQQSRIDQEIQTCGKNHLSRLLRENLPYP